MSKNAKDRLVVLEKITAAKLNQDRKFYERYSDYHLQLYAELYTQRTRYKETILDSLRAGTDVTLDVEDYVRILNLKYANDPVSPKGSIKFIGGRFNIGEDVNPEIVSNYALYIADREETAYNEKFRPGKTQSELTTEELHLISKSTSYAYVKLTGTVSGLLDISDGDGLTEFLSVISRFKISQGCKALAKRAGIDQWTLVSNYDELFHMCLDANWRLHPSLLSIPATSQIFGNLVREAGYTGIIFPSTVHGGQCVALFPENFDDNSMVCAKDPTDQTNQSCLDSESWTDMIKR